MVYVMHTMSPNTWERIDLHGPMELVPIGIAAVKFTNSPTDRDFARAQDLYIDQLPFPRHLSNMRAHDADGAHVTWFGDHARFALANWRRYGEGF